MVDKRSVLKSVVATCAVTAFSGLVPGLTRALNAQTLRTRRSVNTMSLDDPDLSTYRDFVGIMRARSPKDRVSWVGFANQHGDENAFKFCPHGDWYFLPWHRGFVEMYEKAAAALTRNPQFAMPYWDWTGLRELPAAFTDTQYKGKPNPLRVPGLGDDPQLFRNALNGANALTDAIVGPDVMRQIYAETVYEAFGTTRPQGQDSLDPKWVPGGGGFQGVLESTPHNNVHTHLGGYMPNSNSPRDPIFMMHHTNIDRIWASWNALGRRNSSDPLWLDMPFTNNYIAPDGTLYTKKVSDVLDTAALGYTYDVLPKPDDKPLDPERAANLAALFAGQPRTMLARTKRTGLSVAKAATSFGVPFELGAQATAQLQASPAPSTSPREVVALINDIQIPDNVRSIRVFVNRDTVGLDVPVTDPHFVTTLSFLRHGASHGGHHAGPAHGQARPSAVVNLTETLRRLGQSKGLPNNTVTVQLVAVPAPSTPASNVGTVVPGSIEVALI